MGRYRRRQREVVIHGTVTPAEWDSHRALSRVWIITDDERRYEVCDDQYGRELLDYPYEYVRAWGVLDQTGGGALFHLEDFEPMDLDDIAGSDEPH